ncbi:glycosyltransferase 87 family protein [Actinoplanes sp. GCM10030250]|uniref:glycosyltransferase 87 family protein n=1 Tax=Actinoplanes sp. GCM10030250 TaxID=3273376 RepID=UPI003617A24B
MKHPISRIQARISAVLPEVLLASGLLGVAVLVRYLGWGMVAGDYRIYLEPWSRFIAEHGMFSALRFGFADYNVPYLYVLTGFTWLDAHTPIPLMTWIKGFSAVFDAVLAYYVARLVALRGRNWRMPLLAGLTVLVLPTVVLNGAYWAQCDSIYAAFSVAGLYHLIRQRPWIGSVLIGVALALKLQTIFIFPVLLVLLLGRRMPWRSLIAFPAVYVLLAVPAWLAGRPFADLMMIYANQTKTYPSLTLNAPTIYAFITPRSPALLETARSAGILFAIAAVLILTYLITVRRLRLSNERLVLLAATSSMLVPFLLPGMHERYFILAEVLTVAAAFWLPRALWFVPILVQAASMVTYLNYLMSAQPSPVDLRILALLMLGALVATGARLLRPDPAPLTATIPAPALGHLPGAQRSPESGTAVIAGR